MGAAQEISKVSLDREFLSIRSRLLDIASALDRVSAAGDDPRMRQIHDALRAVADESDGRASRVQMLFSLPYEEDWRSVDA